MRLRLLGIALQAVFGLALITTTSFGLQESANGATTPKCPSASVVSSAIGSTVPTATIGNSTISGKTTSDCSYGSIIQIGFATPATTAAYQSLLKEYQRGNPTTKTVSGLGGGAFSYDISNNFSTSCSNGKCTTTQNKNAKPMNYLTVLEAGKSLLEFSGLNSKVTIAEEIALARKVL